RAAAGGLPRRTAEGGEDNRTAAGSERRRPSARGGDLPPHCRDRSGVVPAAENRRARDEYVSSCARDPPDVVDLDAAVDLEAYRQARAVDDRASRLELADRRLDERLPSEARVHGH